MPLKSNVVHIDYTNYAGVRSMRKIIPGSLEFANNKWHPDAQWLLHAYDLGKGAIRTFAMASIHSWHLPGSRAASADISIAKQLQASIERNSRMVERLRKLLDNPISSKEVVHDDLRFAIERILKDEDPA